MPQRNPRITPGENIFSEIKKGDILLHHPYETFDPVVDFIKQAAKDEEGAGHQADPVPGQRQFSDYRRAGQEPLRTASR